MGEKSAFLAGIDGGHVFDFGLSAESINCRFFVFIVLLLFLILNYHGKVMMCVCVCVFESNHFTSKH